MLRLWWNLKMYEQFQNKCISNFKKISYDISNSKTKKIRAQKWSYLVLYFNFFFYFWLFVSNEMNDVVHKVLGAHYESSYRFD